MVSFDLSFDHNQIILQSKWIPVLASKKRFKQKIQNKSYSLSPVKKTLHGRPERLYKVQMDIKFV